MYKYSGDNKLAVQQPSPVLYQHKLYPVQPNPAQGKVHIDFDINGHQTNTVLEIVNLDGRKIYPVMHGYLSPGHYTYGWDGKDAPAGNYVVWLGTDEIPMTARFILLQQ